jgi:hypothetical protein
MAVRAPGVRTWMSDGTRVEIRMPRSAWYMSVMVRDEASTGGSRF